MANRRAYFDEDWFTRAPELDFLGRTVRVMPPEELIWDKLYIMQRERCDWPDILNLLHKTRRTLDWDHLLARLGEDHGLFTGLLSVYRWMCPGAAPDVPARVWKAVGLAVPRVNGCPAVAQERVDFLDTRPWFNVSRSAS
jgi:hypothetical protein